MREILRRILQPEDPPRLFGKVRSVLADGRYSIEDEQGRKITVDGDAGYLPGVDVVIQNGRIVRHGKRSPALKTYKV